MAQPDRNNPLTPRFDVTISGESYARAFQGNLRSLTVDDDLRLPAMFTIELAGSADEKDELPWLDNDSRLELGGAVEIRFGWHDQLQAVMTGEIMAIEPEFGAGRSPVMRLRGYDARQRLQRGVHTRTFVDSKDSDIVEQIGRAAGLKVDAQDSGIVHQYVMQANQTDLGFLLDRADRIGFELLMRDGRLMFRPAAFDAGETMTLSVAGDLLEFSACASIAQQPSGVEMRSWDVAAKQALLARADGGSERAVMGSESGAALADRIGGNGSAHHAAVPPAATQDEIDALARARFNEAGLALVTAECLVLGRTDLRAGSVVKIEGAGKRFSGAYYVRSTQHRYTPALGYTTRFAAGRNAL